MQKARLAQGGPVGRHDAKSGPGFWVGTLGIQLTDGSLPQGVVGVQATAYNLAGGIHWTSASATFFGGALTPIRQRRLPVPSGLYSAT